MSNNLPNKLFGFIHQIPNMQRFIMFLIDECSIQSYVIVHVYIIRCVSWWVIIFFVRRKSTRNGSRTRHVLLTTAWSDNVWPSPLSKTKQEISKRQPGRTPSSLPPPWFVFVVASWYSWIIRIRVVQFLDFISHQQIYIHNIFWNTVLIYWS